MKTKIVIAVVLVLAALSFAPRATFSHQKVDDWEKQPNRLQPPDKVMDAIGIEPGMVVGEIGAGRGRYTVHLAVRVGETGKIYANDVNEHSLAYLKRRCKRDGIDNLVTILGKVADPCFPSSKLDVVFMINTYHHLNEPVEILKNAAPALKPSGILAIVEHDPEKTGGGWGKESTAREVILKHAERAGYDLVRVETFLERDNIYIFRPRNMRQ